MRILFVALLCLSLASLGQSPASVNRFIVIAHRGDHTQAPENTMKAFEDAIKVGVDFIEVDLRSSKDGQLIIMHDETINRMTNGKGSVHELMWSDLQSLRVSDKNRPEWGTHPIPTFAEVLTLCKNKVGIYLDFKRAPVALAWKEIQDADMQQFVVVYINTEEQYKQWRTLAPDVPLIVCLPGLNDKNQVHDFLKKVDAEILDGGYTEYTIEKAAAVHESDRKIWADIQHPEENELMWKKAIGLPVDGLQTDHPGELIEFLKKIKLR